MLEQPDGGITRIAVFPDTLEGGGTQRRMLKIAAGLAQRGEAVTMLVRHLGGPYAHLVPDDVGLVSLNAGRMRHALVPMARWVRRARPRVLIAGLPQANIVAFFASWLAGGDVRVVVNEVNAPSQTARQGTKRRFINALALWVYKRADAVIVGSTGIRDELVARGVSQERLHVLANPVDLDAVGRAVEEEPGHPWLAEDADVPVILAAGRLTYQKGFDVLLRAFAEVHARRRARLLVIGEGEERPALMELAQRLNVAEDVDFPGFVANPFAYMSRARLFVLSSRWEGSPNVLIQALACACPCVSTDCPHGPVEILEGGRYGDLVPVDDSEALAGGIAKALESNPDRQACVTRAQAYGAPAVLDRWREVVLGIGGNAGDSTGGRV